MLALKNNFIMPPLKLGYCEEPGFVNDKHLNFYKQTGKYLGALTIEPLFMDLSLRELPTQLGIDNDDKIAGLKVLTDALHKFETKVIAHLNHPGRMANPMIPDNVFISATDKACPTGGKTPRSMNEKDMKAVINLFVSTARRAEKAGFDFIEIQSGHGYLLAQFLSPQTNDRHDSYGGSFDNRIKFPLQVIQAVKQAVNIPVIVRVSGEEMIHKGIKIDETIAYTKLLEQIGIVALHVSSGTVCETPPWYFQHMFVPKGKTWKFAATINNETAIPVIFVGQINTPEDIETIKNEYQGKYMAVGRALVADPNFIGKYLGFVDESYRPCLACSEGCLGGVKSGNGLSCMVNPEVNNLNIIPKNNITRSKKIAIIGGGLAGMEAAIRLHKKGHHISIFEKNKLGGQFNLAWLPPNKVTLKKILDYYFTEIKKLRIPIIKKQATANEILSNSFDEVIIATGAKPAIPTVKGLHKYHWAELLEDKLPPKNKKIVIVGGGLIGTELASKLIDFDNEIILVEMLDDIARGMEIIERKLTLKKLINKQVAIFKNHKVIEVNEAAKTVVIQSEEKTTLVNIDLIIMATGMKSNKQLAEELEGKIKYHLIGDAIQPAKAQDAIASGYKVAITI